MRKRIAIVGAVIGTTAGIGIGRVVRTWRTWGIDPDARPSRSPAMSSSRARLPSRPAAITIDAPPEAVWPWLVQMGFDRGGWYSYDQLDMRGTSVGEILPEYQAVAVGDVDPDRRRRPGSSCAAVEPATGAGPVQRHGAASRTRRPQRRPSDAQRPDVPAGLAASGAFLGRTPQDFAASWAFVLEPLDGGRTRLIERFRVRFEATGPTFRVIGPIMGFGVFVDGPAPAARHPASGPSSTAVAPPVEPSRASRSTPCPGQRPIGRPAGRNRGRRRRSLSLGRDGPHAPGSRSGPCRRLAAWASMP